MGTVNGNWLTGAHSGRACNHENIYTKTNRKTGKCYSVKLCNPSSMVSEMQAAHRTSFGICYEGGLDADGHPCDTRMPAQKQSLITLLKQLKTRYPHACIASHHTFDPRKSCPCFDAEHEYIEL